ncbi:MULTISPECIES: aminoglycoside phosphotransferase family protein [unclassified Kaistella]|uniref:aminoglycoside phosphotransferase family protein n=1 Tax=unclassified Kaistella TaxID=2762626 RepID=UPI0027371905|nr:MULTISPECIES: phosphotransferase [unclassified Kaistella]MDP2454976.1 phosphotransferase [Kaistella sp. SH11-4b]MDP2456041.1 phosphotransferase [Kaistella sp. SH40-3]MDP2460646.1 phosphotransferase [Kaistella sp. SH19-2b]
MTDQNAKYFFENYTHEAAQDFFTLAQSGSARINYVGKSSGKNYIITYNENIPENESFYYFSNLFSDLKVNAPKVLKISDDRKLYIQEFLGDQTLSEVIEKEGLTERVKTLVKKTLQQLAEVQIKTEDQIDYSQTFEYAKYDELPITSDLFYFKSFIADVLEIPYHKSSLLMEFKKIVSKIEQLEPKGIMMRDFQARNIMVNDDDEVFFIDYQSAMKGPLIYDVISFLFQAKANFPADFKNKMLNYYFSFWGAEKQLQLRNSVKPIQLIRFLQVLGAYGFRGLIQRKQHFISSIDQGIENLYQFSTSWEEMNEYPALKNLISELKSKSVEDKIKNIIFNQ